MSKKNISNLINCIDLKHFEMIVIIESESSFGHAFYQPHTYKYNKTYLGATSSSFISDEEGAMSEIAI